MKTATILTVNAGSSSVRLALFERRESKPAKIASKRLDANAAEAGEALVEFLSANGCEAADAVAHRVVHGGAKLIAPRAIDGEVEAEIERVSKLAPLHNERALEWIRAARGRLGGSTPHIAVFDTAFFANLPERASTYPIPLELQQRLGIRRFGFHGLAHEAMWRTWSACRSGSDNGRLITFQLGSGCSAAAIVNGRPIDTSMGFTPAEGLMMATRSGDVDPGLLLHLMSETGMGTGEISDLLNHQSGLLGVSEIGGDMSELLESSDPRAKLAIEMFCYRAQKYLGAYLAALGGADAVAFGGGIGEHAPIVRAKILSRMQWCGIELDEARNRAAVARDERITREGSRIEVHVIRVDEEAILGEAGLGHIS